MLALNSRPSRLSLPSAGTAVLRLHTGLFLPTGVRVLGAGERRPAQGDFEAEGGAATPERGTEGAREDVPTAVPYELRAGSARPCGQLSATMTPQLAPLLFSSEPGFAHPRVSLRTRVQRVPVPVPLLGRSSGASLGSACMRREPVFKL